MAAASNGASAAQPQQTIGPADPDSYPLAAQIPLKDFILPEFPPHASRLRELTLTADIKLDEYQAMLQERPLTQPPLPNVPSSITHLTLELFGLGFPGTPPFLGRLAKALPNLTSLTFFSCLIDGLDDASRKDAERLFEGCAKLQEVHVIDSFARPGFFKAVGEILEKRCGGGDGGDGGSGDNGLKVVDVSYTFRGHEDSDFLARVAGEELASLIVPGLIGASFDFVPVPRRDELEEESGGTEGAEVERREGDKSNKKEKKKEKMPEGILPFASDGRAPAAMKKRFEKLSTPEGPLRSVKVLNLGMFSLRPVEVGEIVYACAGGGGEGHEAGLVDLTVAVLLEENWAADLVKGFGYKEVGGALEGIEIIGVPDRASKGTTEAKAEEEDWQQGSIELVKKGDVERLEKACPKLGKVGMSILKVRSAPNVVYLKEEDGWKAM
ncbi:hypothetical protein LTR47_002317 [Exophiala xenobiotica]|nr:hypothetical protein LTR47_002317 [Exophiala xenobiotica]KAK5248890.1 hypothetical protein LTS06_006189 [Exophiala xenobiotica]KAK5350477.1 hypothetical protein LTR61_005674 [Exophiala xenobiotica]KAK5378109.1 hypothetical protein LTS03_004985 [Exophiala xenobiotica]KAK5389527.1 hypothetical protein LTR11_000337 [Exophiala xenobiotica]